MIDKNYVVDNKYLERNRDLLKYLFSDFDNVLEEITYIDTTYDMYDILVNAGLFTSKGDAKKNWKRSGQEIPLGFSDFRDIGKLNNRLTIYNPMRI